MDMIALPGVVTESKNPTPLLGADAALRFPRILRICFALLPAYAPVETVGPIIRMIGAYTTPHGAPKAGLNAAMIKRNEMPANKGRFV